MGGQDRSPVRINLDQRMSGENRQDGRIIDLEWNRHVVHGENDEAIMDGVTNYMHLGRN